ncbi:CoA transferase [Caballeronia udeis]
MCTNIAGVSPFRGVKVIELTHLIAGPYCGQLLAEEGTDVILNRAARRRAYTASRTDASIQQRNHLRLLRFAQPG